ncbi:MAG: hypothetical protein GY941_30455 [Planctomycetes bacterium]|nr:hypothetical protein [Planctomycetota bacterium]
MRTIRIEDLPVEASTLSQNEMKKIKGGTNWPTWARYIEIPRSRVDHEDVTD